jgi:serine/threonine protein kinase
MSAAVIYPTTGPRRRPSSLDSFCGKRQQKYFPNPTFAMLSGGTNLNEMTVWVRSWVQGLLAEHSDRASLCNELSAAFLELFQLVASLEEQHSSADDGDTVGLEESCKTTLGENAHRRRTVCAVSRKASVPATVQPVKEIVQPNPLSGSLNSNTGSLRRSSVVACGNGLRLARMVGVHQLQAAAQESGRISAVNSQGSRGGGGDRAGVQPKEATPIPRMANPLSEDLDDPSLQQILTTQMLQENRKADCASTSLFSQISSADPPLQHSANQPSIAIETDLSFRDSLKLVPETPLLLQGDSSFPRPAYANRATSSKEKEKQDKKLTTISSNTTGSSSDDSYKPFPGLLDFQSPSELALLVAREKEEENDQSDQVDRPKTPAADVASRSTPSLHHRPSCRSIISRDEPTPSLCPVGGSATPELKVMEGTTETRPYDGASIICSFEIIAELGKGSFGTVSLAVDAEDETFAIKTLHRGKKVNRRPDTNSSTNNGGAYHNTNGSGNNNNPLTSTIMSLLGPNSNEEEKKKNGVADAVEREIAIMKRLNHPNVVKLHAVIEDPQEGQTHLVIQYVENGPVAKANSDGTCHPIPLGLAMHYMGQVARGLQYLHRCGIIHRDIKTENILIGKNGTALVSDFGVSSILTDGDLPQGRAGTLAYFSPELLCNAEAINEFGVESDVWAFGVTLYALIFGRLPFRGSTGPSLVRSILMEAPNFPTDFPLPVVTPQVAPGSPSPSSSNSKAEPSASDSLGDSQTPTKLMGMQASTNGPSSSSDLGSGSSFPTVICPTPPAQSAFPETTDPEGPTMRTVKLLLTQLLEKDPVRRMTLEEFRRHPLVRRFRKDANAPPPPNRSPRHPAQLGGAGDSTASESLEMRDSAESGGDLGFSLCVHHENLDITAEEVHNAVIQVPVEFSRRLSETTVPILASTRGL